MKISKYLHSCLVFELDGYKILFDPGKFSFADGEVTADMFADVDIIIVTHIHADHLDTEILTRIIELSNARLYANSQVSAELAKANLKHSILHEGTHTFGPFKLEAIDVVHEPILDNALPQMTGFIINDKVLHPVDSMEKDLLKYKGIDVLLMVTMAPFTNELHITDFADRLQPKQIIPIHDGYAKAFFIDQRYQAYAKHFDKQGIKFWPIYKVGESVTV